jgi:signal transduction histidine kinase
MRNISDDIHDNIGQTLTGAKLNLNAMTSSNYEEHSANAKGLITRSLQDLRNLSKTLNGDFNLREGLQNAIAREVDVINSSGELNCIFDGDIPAGWLMPNSEIILFRCVQEALSNALKHAQAGNINVVSAVMKDMLTLEIGDDGVGFQHSEENAKGVGMGSMTKRIGMLGGTFNIESGKGCGTKVLIKLPKYKSDS